MAVTTALSHGDLHAAAANVSLPNPPGYPLAASLVVATLRPWIGAETWCPGELTARQRLRSCPGRPSWLHSQGVLGLLCWAVLAAGGLSLLGATGVRRLRNELGLVAFLVIVPSATSALVEFFHPQDMLSLGLGLFGLSSAIRRRSLAAGVLFGLAVLSKQFAFLLLLPVYVVVPTRLRLRLVAAFLLTVTAGLLPFALAAPHATWENFSGLSGGGALEGQTVLTLAGIHGSVASAIARDAPVVFAALICWRLGRRVTTHAQLLGLVLACVGSRLVFESVVYPYYLLATSVIFLLADLVAEVVPSTSLLWCAAAAFFVAYRPTGRAVEAFGTLALAIAAVAVGLGRTRVIGASELAAAPS